MIRMARKESDGDTILFIGKWAGPIMIGLALIIVMVMVYFGGHGSAGTGDGGNVAWRVLGEFFSI